MKSVTGKSKVNLLESNEYVGSVRFHLAAKEAKLRWAEATGARKTKRKAVGLIIA